jgi:hypothetical protein
MEIFRRKEWSYGSNIQNREYLSRDESFETLVEELSAGLRKADSSSVRFLIEPKNGKYSDEDPLLKVLKCKRPIWWIQLDERILDKFFNSRMGIRAQYYVNTYHGQKKNRHLISQLTDSLIRTAPEEYLRQAGVDQSFLRKSLSQSSAKAWISEKNVKGKKIIRAGNQTLDDQSIQNDWLDIAKDVKKGVYGGDDYQLYCAAVNGVQAPIPDQLEIKGAWLTGSSHN